MQLVISGTSILTTAYAGAMEIAITPPPTQTQQGGSGCTGITLPTPDRSYKLYYSAGTQLMAMRVLTYGSCSGVLYFLSSDHLGSSSLTTDASGNFVARQLYDAWGNIRSGGGIPTDIGYTGQRLDSGTNLLFMHARYYDSQIGRWSSPDSIIPDESSPQSLNRYSYGLNNPVKYTDPSGHDVDCGIGDPRSCRNQAAQDIRREHALDGKYTTWDQLTAYELKLLTSTGYDTKETWNGALDDRFHGGLTDVAGTLMDPAMLIPIGGAGKIAWSAGEELLARLGIKCLTNPLCATLFGKAGEEVLNGESENSSEQININAERLAHVLDGHMPGGIDSAGNSLFNANEDIVNLIRQAEALNPSPQSWGSNFQRIVDAGRVIGIDRVTNLPTSIYTVITDGNGNLITAFPGVPSQ